MKHKFLSFLSLLLVLLTASSSLLAFAAETVDDGHASAAVAVDEADLSNADTVLLYCLETDTVLRTKNADQTIYPATAVKLMTALLSYETIEDLTTPITVTGEMIAEVSGTYYGFKAGDTVSPEDLIKLLLLRKSNDAALILAHLSAGSTDAFVTAMNRRADELGMENTFFVNPTGMHDASMTTTAEDLLILSLAFYSNTVLHGWSGSAYLSCPTLSAGTIHNNNYFLGRYYNGTGVTYLFDAVDGMINGSTTQAGDVLITSATYKGLHYVVILLGGKKVDELPACYEITRDLLEKDTQNFRYTKVLLDAEVVCELPVRLGSGADSAAVFAKETVECYLPKSLDLSRIQRKIELTVDSLEAPVEEGDKVGTVSVWLDGKLLGETDLIVRSNIVRSGTEYRISQITAYLSSSRFVVVALVVIGLFILYFLINAIYREQVKKKYHPDRD